METCHRGVSGMIINKVFYLGLLKEYNFEIFNLDKAENIKLLISNKVIEEKNVLPQSDSQNQNILKESVILNNKLYSINESLISEITTEIDSYIKSNTDEIFKEKEKIDRELFKLIKAEDKLKKLNEIKAQKIDLIKKFYDYLEYEKNQKSFLLEFSLFQLFYHQPEYLSSYLLYPTSNKNLITWYCHCRKFYECSMGPNINTEEIKNLYNLWDNWYSKGYIIKYCNEEIEKLNKPKEKKLKNGSFDLENIKSNYNRDKQVFKSPYNCEFFIYLMNELNYNDNKIVFSYFFEILKSNKLLNNNVKNKDYLSFFNNQFELTETRLRTNLSNEIYNDYMSFYLKCEKEFQTKVSENK